MHRTTLCLIEMAGTKTAPHADWADAKNFAIAVGRKVWHSNLWHACQHQVILDGINAFIQVKQGAALARWVFVNPCCIARANEYAERELKHCPKGFNTPRMDTTHLTLSSVSKLMLPNSASSWAKTLKQGGLMYTHCISTMARWCTCLLDGCTRWRTCKTASR